jgi:phosphopentomutase
MAEKSYKKFKRIFGIVMDSVGIGEGPDAAKFNDVGCDTLGHIGESYPGDFSLPNMGKMGLSNIRPENPIKGVPVADPAVGYFGKAHELAVDNDSMEGHWEMMGLPMLEHAGHFPDGFPDDIIEKLEKFSGRKVVLNKPYSGTDAIRDYGEEQKKTGALIVYTSGDSVLQIAANTDIIPLKELYKICEYARKITIPLRVGRIIARPYVYKDPQHFTRTSDRHDFTLPPIDTTDLDRLKDAGYDVLGVGKINDLFSGQGITEGWHTTSNEDGMDHTIANLDRDFTGFSFTNLVDFDAKYGHRRNVKGDGDALMALDKRIGEMMEKMNDDDLMFITADHGNDPTFRGTDHTREYVPVLMYSPGLPGGKSLGVADTFANLGATVLDNFNVEQGKYGESLLDKLN